MLQTLGTEWGRYALHPDFWLMCMRRRLDVYSQVPDLVVVIPDARFENEAALIREHGGAIVHVVRPGADSSDTHASEVGVAVQEHDIVAYNSEDLVFWRQAADRIHQQVVHGGQQA